MACHTRNWLPPPLESNGHGRLRREEVIVMSRWWLVVAKGDRATGTPDVRHARHTTVIATALGEEDVVCHGGS